MTPVARPQYRLATSGFIFCAAFAASLLLSVVLNAALPTSVFLWVYSFLSPTIMAVIALVGGRLDSVDVPEALGLRRPLRAWQWLLAVALAVSCIAMSLPIANGVQYVFGLLGYHQTPTYADYTSSWGNFAMGMASIALLPAFAEECLLRGVVMGSMKEKGTYYAVFGSALLFAFMHGSPIQLVHQFLIGVVMAVLVLTTRTIWASVLFHFVNNAVVLSYEFAYTQAGWTYTIPWWVLLIMFVVGAPISALLLVCWGRRSVAALPKEGEPQTASKQPLAHRIKRVLDCHGEFLPYNKHTDGVSVVVAFVLVGIIWIINTVSGWMV